MVPPLEEIPGRIQPNTKGVSHNNATDNVETITLILNSASKKWKEDYASGREFIQKEFRPQ